MIVSWFKTLLSGKPHFIIGGIDNPYMLRWWVIPRNPMLNIFIHKFVRSDDDRALHDHPWPFMSFLLSGSYQEITDTSIILRQRFSSGIHKASHRHRVVLLEGAQRRELPCWTLVITGPKIREWGFWCPRGFVHWKSFTAPADKGQIGGGCE